MRIFFVLASSLVLALGTSGAPTAQETASPFQGPPHVFQQAHGPRTIDQELDHLTKELDLTADQRRQIIPLLQQHHDRIQTLFDRNPTLSRQALAEQIHAVSDDTHQQIEALLTDRQKQLAKAMQHRMRATGEERLHPM
jgi:Spy/CpxP family protein refolding chaperone